MCTLRLPEGTRSRTTQMDTRTHYTDTLHSDNTLDFDDNQATVRNCSTPSAGSPQEARLAILLNKRLPHSEEYIGHCIDVPFRRGRPGRMLRKGKGVGQKAHQSHAGAGSTCSLQHLEHRRGQPRSVVWYRLCWDRLQHMLKGGWWVRANSLVGTACGEGMGVRALLLWKLTAVEGPLEHGGSADCTTVACGQNVPDRARRRAVGRQKKQL